MFGGLYSGRRVLVTGHTGFKGSWLTLWLRELGAVVAGYSDCVSTSPAHFEELGLENEIVHYRGDVRDRQGLVMAFQEFQPEVVFHLAAQALVRRSYADPAGTIEVNALGTLNILECLRTMPGVKAAVMVTSDKCYRNAEWVWGYRESDPLGGEDPYSSSKACAELICSSYFHSFFGSAGMPAVATARAGNVIGGGDWALDRIVPDCVRAWSRNEPVVVRNSGSTRPWQHVLEPLSGYLWLAKTLWDRRSSSVSNSFNFGPAPSVIHSVGTLIEALAGHWPSARWEQQQQSPAVAEATLLKLSCDKAWAKLQWQAVLDFDDTVRFTADWYRNYHATQGVDVSELSKRQIAQFCEQARDQSLQWAS